MDIINDFLRKGSNRRNSKARIIFHYQIGQADETFFREEYRNGGIGLVLDGTKSASWFDEFGMQIGMGETAKTSPILSWEEVAKRVSALLEQGEYATQNELDSAKTIVAKEYAQELVDMRRDCTDAEMFRGTDLFENCCNPEFVNQLAESFRDPAQLQSLISCMEVFTSAYQKDSSLLRWNYCKPERILKNLRKLQMESIPCYSKAVIKETPIFITQDEIDQFLTQGNSDKRLRIYACFIQEHSETEQAEFMKQFYGTGGCSPALPNADDSDANYDAKGLRLRKGRWTGNEAESFLRWPAVAKRINVLIQNEEFLKAADYERMPEFERKEMVNRVIRFYDHVPKEVERPFTDDFFHEEARKELFQKLSKPGSARKLVSQMEAALIDPAGYPLFGEVRDYVKGTYTIFPQISTNRQLSIFDFL